MVEGQNNICLLLRLDVLKVSMLIDVSTGRSTGPFIPVSSSLFLRAYLASLTRVLAALVDEAIGYRTLLAVRMTLISSP